MYTWHLTGGDCARLSHLILEILASFLIPHKPAETPGRKVSAVQTRSRTFITVCDTLRFPTYESKVRDYLLSLIVKLEKMKKVPEAVQVWSFCKELKRSRKFAEISDSFKSWGASPTMQIRFRLNNGICRNSSRFPRYDVSRQCWVTSRAWLNARACYLIGWFAIFVWEFTSTFALFSNLVSRSVNFNFESIEPSSQVLHAFRRFRVNWGKFWARRSMFQPSTVQQSSESE